jgi:hypothetical protein
MMVLCVAGLLAAVAQQRQDDEATRQLWDTAFINQGNKRPGAKKPARRHYRIVTPQIPVMDVSPDTVIGVTLWRLRPTRSADTGERIITHDGPDSVTWLPERISSSGRLSEGDRTFTLSIRSNTRMAQRASLI